MKKLRSTLEVLLALEEDEKTTSKICAELNKPTANVHNNLKKLEENHLVKTQKQGKINFWSLNSDGAWLKRYISVNPSALNLNLWKELAALLSLRKKASNLTNLNRRQLRKLISDGIIARNSLVAQEKFGIPKEFESSLLEKEIPAPRYGIKISEVIDLSHKLSKNMAQFWFEEPIDIKTIAYSTKTNQFMTMSILNNLRTQVGTSIDLRGHVTSDPAKEKGLSSYAPGEFIKPAIVADLSYKHRILEPYIRQHYLLDVVKMGNASVLIKKLEITKKELQFACRNHELNGGEYLILYTGFDKYWIDAPIKTTEENPPAYLLNPYLSWDAVEWIKKNKFGGVGIDAYSIEKPALPITPPSKGEVRYEVEKGRMKHDALLDVGPIIENMTALDKIRGKRSIIISLPIKIDECADGFPVWATALVLE